MYELAWADDALVLDYRSAFKILFAKGLFRV